jgi:DNA polymerase-3 subunit delta'
VSSAPISRQQRIFPWQKTPWDQLLHTRAQARLPHAMLFVGIEGIGKRRLAEQFAALLLCTQSAGQQFACGVCHGCHMLQANSHPDYLCIEPEEAGKAITVDQIRSLIKQINETAHAGGFRVIIIDPAAAMNINAANALLKTLEEPTPNTLIILISHPGGRLPATVISRCQKFMLTKPAHAEAVNWLKEQLADDKVDLQLLLKLADGAPLQALNLWQNEMFSLRQDLYEGLHSLSQGDADPLKLAASWQNTDQVQVVDLLLSWLTDLLRYKLTQDPADLVNTDYKAQIANVSVLLLKNNLLAYIDHLQQTRAYLSTSINLNKQLLLEDLLIRWTEYVSS